MKTKILYFSNIAIAILLSGTFFIASCSKEKSELSDEISLHGLSGEKFVQACIKKGLIYDKAVLLGIGLTSRSGVGTDALTINYGLLK